MKPFNRNDKGFTLVELLVVISIIALLLSILMPALGKVRKQAQSVMCRTNLKTWGTYYQLYAVDNNGRFPIRSEMALTWGYTDTFLTGNIAEAESLAKSMICPSSKKVPGLGNNTGPLGHEFGGTWHCWLLTNMPFSEPGSHSSYGENAWIRNVADRDVYSVARNQKTWKSMELVKTPYKVPIMLDSRFTYAWPDNTDPLPPIREVPEKLFFNSYNWMSINSFVMRRHGNGLNVVTVDMAVARIPAEKLWDLKWHREYQARDIGNRLSWMKNY